MNKGWGRLLGAFWLLLGAHAALAQSNYPDRPIRLIVGFAPGGGADSGARVLARALGDRLKQTIIVDNRVGAGSQTAALAVVKAEPDGYTIGLATIAYAIQAAIDPKMEFDPLNDLAHIGLTNGGPYVIVVNPAVPARTLPELLAWIRSKPEVNYASAGVGSGLHMAGEMFRDVAKLKLVHVPYRGEGPAIIDVASGQVPFMFSSITNAQSMIQAGKVRPIAMSSTTRAPQLPNVPTMDEGGLKGFEVIAWGGYVAPKKTPPAILTKLSQELNEVMKTPEIQAQFAQLGSGVLTSNSPQEFTAFMQREIARYRDIGAKAGIAISK